VAQAAAAHEVQTVSFSAGTTAGLASKRPQEARAAQRRAGAAAAPRGSIWGSLLLFSLLFPPETSFYLGSFRLTAYRLLVILATPLCAYLLWSKRAGPLRAADWMLLLHTLWATAAIAIHHGAAEYEAMGIYAFECFGAYMMGRVFIRSVADLRRVATTLVWTVVLMSLLTIPESITGRHYIREIAGLIRRMPFESWVGARFGLARAFGPFEHPILYGVYCASAAGMAVFTCAGFFRTALRRVAALAIVAAATVASVSSGAVLPLMVQLILLTYERVTRWLRGRWLLLSIVVLLLYVFIDWLSNRSGIRVLLSYLTFNSGTALGRIDIWRYGGREVIDSPLFGIGFNDWRRPEWWDSSSVDAFWLLTAMRYGLPAALLLAGAALASMVAVGRRIRTEGRNASPLLGFELSLLALVLAAFTVHYWNGIFVYFLFLVGAGVSLGAGAAEASVLTRPATAGGAAGRRVR